MFQLLFKKVFLSVSKIVRVYQGGSVYESLLLHDTYCSYLSRRRACLTFVNFCSYLLTFDGR